MLCQSIILMLFLSSDGVLSERRLNHGKRERLGHSSAMKKARETNYQEHPYFALIMKDIFPERFYRACSGVFLTSQTVLTVAHCVSDEKFKYQIHHGGMNYPINGVFFHPNYTESTPGSDYVVVRLETPIQGKFMPIALPEPGEHEEAVEQLFDFNVVAMGKSSPDDTKQILKEAMVTQIKACTGSDHSPWTLCTWKQSSSLSDGVFPSTHNVNHVKSFSLFHSLLQVTRAHRCT